MGDYDHLTAEYRAEVDDARDRRQEAYAAAELKRSAITKPLSGRVGGPGADMPAYEAAWEEFRAAAKTIDNDLSAAIDTAWKNIATQANDPLVTWIIDNCSEYHDAASLIIDLLPAALERLDEFAEEEGWCGTWDDFRERAIKAGVIAVPPEPSEERKAVYGYVDSLCRGGMHSGQLRKLSELIDTMVAAEQAAPAPSG